METGRIRVDVLLGSVFFWAVACLLCAVLGGSHYLDHWQDLGRDLFGPPAGPAPAMASPAVAYGPAICYRTSGLDAAIELACGPGNKGRPVPGTRDIQCFDAAGRASFYATGAQP